MVEYTMNNEDLIKSLKLQVAMLKDEIKELKKEKGSNCDNAYDAYIELLENHNRIIHVYGPQIIYDAIVPNSGQQKLNIVTEYPILFKDAFVKAFKNDWELDLYHEEDDGKISKIAYSFKTGKYRKIQEQTDVFDNVPYFKGGTYFYEDEEDVKSTKPYYDDDNGKIVDVEFENSESCECCNNDFYSNVDVCEDCDHEFYCYDKNHPDKFKHSGNDEPSEGDISSSEKEELNQYKELFKKWKKHVDELVNKENGHETDIKASREEAKEKEVLHNKQI